MSMKTPEHSAASGTAMLPRLEAERNRLSLEWTNAHWAEIEETPIEQRPAMRERKAAWVESQLAKLKLPA